MKYILIIFLLMCAGEAHAQNSSAYNFGWSNAGALVGIGTATPRNSSTLDVNGVINASSPIIKPAYTVSALPSTAGTGKTQGAMALVTDQLTTCAVAGAALTGGGSVVCPVFYNGSAWVGD